MFSSGSKFCQRVNLREHPMDGAIITLLRNEGVDFLSSDGRVTQKAKILGSEDPSYIAFSRGFHGNYIRFLKRGFIV